MKTTVTNGGARQHATLRVFTAPARYIQGPGALDRLPDLCAGLCHQPVAIIDAGIATWLAPRLLAGQPGMGMIHFAGEITHERADQLAAEASDADLIVAVGGGKALDAGKAAAHRLGLPVITVPTIASTDAPASRGIALYDTAHRLVAVEQMACNPVCVLVDTSLIANAPARFLLAGIGDALAKKFEAEACARDGGLTKHGTPPGCTALAIADGCYRILRRDAAAALQSIEAKNPGAALEAVVEACLLMSGLGFENGGLSLAHAMTRGLMVGRNTAAQPHGFHVAYGLLLHLVLDGQSDDELRDMLRFYAEIGMPGSLTELGLTDPTPAELSAMAEANLAAPSMRNAARAMEAAEIVAAMRRVEELALSPR